MSWDTKSVIYDQILPYGENLVKIGAAAPDITVLKGLF